MIMITDVDVDWLVLHFDTLGNSIWFQFEYSPLLDITNIFQYLYSVNTAWKLLQMGVNRNILYD